MSTTDPIAQISAQTQAALAAAKSKQADQLGINEFLHLMTVQLRNQDPMKPLDATDFVAQLAQFGSVSGIQNMQSSMSSLAESLRSTQVLNGASLVGRDILSSTSETTILSGGTVRGEIDVPEGIGSMTIVVTDDAGQVVRTMISNPAAGINEFTWDGLDERGEAVESGTYQIEAIANVGGANYSLETLLSTRVSSVSIGAGGTDLILNTNIGPIALADVRRVI